MRKALRLVGWLLLALAGLGILGWLQAGDPDCYLSTGEFLQLRLCADETVGGPTGRPGWLLGLALAVMLAGLGCLRLGRDPRAEEEGA